MSDIFVHRHSLLYCYQMWLPLNAERHALDGKCWLAWEIGFEIICAINYFILFSKKSFRTSKVMEKRDDNKCSLKPIFTALLEAFLPRSECFVMVTVLEIALGKELDIVYSITAFFQHITHNCRSSILPALPIWVAADNGW